MTETRRGRRTVVALQCADTGNGGTLVVDIEPGGNGSVAVSRADHGHRIVLAPEDWTRVAQVIAALGGAATV